MPLVADLIPKIHRQIQWGCSRDEVIALALLLNIIKAEDINGYIKRYDDDNFVIDVKNLEEDDK